MPPKSKPRKQLLGKNRGPKPRAPKGAVVARQQPRVPSRVAPPRSFKSRTLRSSPSGTAPAAVSVMKSMSLHFAGSNAGRHLRTSALIPVCQIGTDLFTNGLVLSTGANTSAPASVALLNPQSLPGSQKDAADPPALVAGRWLSPQLSLIAQAFDRYRPIALEFVYEPQAATSTVDRLVFAYAEDPLHPVLSGFINPSGFTTVPTQTDLLITPDSVAFAPWMPWRLTVPLDTFDELFVSTASAVVAGVPGATARFAFAGMIACRSATSVAAVTYGVLFARVIFDFIDPVPTVQSVTPARLESKKPIPARAGEPIPDSDPSGEEWVYPRPPTYVPAPSLVPGTPTYVAKVPSRK